MARFLLIDDDNTLRQLMAMTLESAGHTVVQAASGDEGVRIFKARAADVIITDIVMPKPSIEAIIEFRLERPGIPFIVVSGLTRHSPHTKEVAKLLHARRTLGKPFHLRDLLKAAEEVLQELKTERAPKRKKT